MGYYVSYCLTAKNVDTEDEFEDLKSALAGIDLIGYVFDEGSYYKNRKEAIFYSFDAQTWPDQRENMKMITSEFPNMMFQILCVGDDGDQWKQYYFGSLIETCSGRMVFETPKKIRWTD